MEPHAITAIARLLGVDCNRLGCINDHADNNQRSIEFNLFLNRSFWKIQKFFPLHARQNSPGSSSFNKLQVRIESHCVAGFFP